MRILPNVLVQDTFGGWAEGTVSGLAMVERLSGTATYYRSHSSPDTMARRAGEGIADNVVAPIVSAMMVGRMAVLAGLANKMGQPGSQPCASKLGSCLHNLPSVLELASPRLQFQGRGEGTRQRRGLMRTKAQHQVVGGEVWEQEAHGSGEMAAHEMSRAVQVARDALGLTDLGLASQARITVKMLRYIKADYVRIQARPHVQKAVGKLLAYFERRKGAK